MCQSPLAHGLLLTGPDFWFCHTSKNRVTLNKLSDIRASVQGLSKMDREPNPFQPADSRGLASHRSDVGFVCEAG